MIPILVPVYVPEKGFVHFMKELTSTVSEKSYGTPIVIVNDGNPLDLPVFNDIKGKNIFIVNHAVNLGKGRALKDGFNFILCTWPHLEGCVTCDADGQHTVRDIVAVIEKLHENPENLIMGCRTFKDNIPFRSKFGNMLTSVIFKILTGIKIADTQTGLRGIPREYMKKCMSLDGERYEFEMNMLLESRKSKVQLTQVPIETVYIDENKSSHFNPFLDSLRIYRLIAKFLFSSLFASLVDFIVFTFAFFFSHNLAFSLILARIISLFLNFKVNKDFVFAFKSQKGKINAFIKYCVLVFINLCLAYFGISFLYKITGVPVYILKVIGESILFFVNYEVQRDFIFKQ